MDMETRESSLELISIVVPMHNEEAALMDFFAELEAVLTPLGFPYEVICVDDGSRDGTLEALIQLRKDKPYIKIVDLSRNFGKEQALTAGLHYAKGDVVIPIDADLQDPPSLISAFIDKWKEGYDVVYGIRDYGDLGGTSSRWLQNLFYKGFNRLADIKMSENIVDFRLMDRRVVKALLQFPERNRFMKGLFTWVGFSQVGVEYKPNKRVAGNSKWNLWKLWNFALDGITGFSTLPLRLWSYFGVLIALLSALYTFVVVLRVFVWGIEVPGYASLMVGILFFGSVQLISMGVLGEYIGRLYREVKKRPVFIVRETYGLEDVKDG
tara:strand:+ start:3460 stop:4431 length:972 start_codon:yes stop_codon:yes gene_type:complete